MSRISKVRTPQTDTQTDATERLPDISYANLFVPRRFVP